MPVPPDGGIPWVSTKEIIAAGNLTVHDPGAGKRFQLFGVVLFIPAGAVVAVRTIMGLYDGAVLFSEMASFKGTNSAPITVYEDYTSIGGIVSTTDANLLVLNNSGAITTDNASITAWGVDV